MFLKDYRYPPEPADPQTLGDLLDWEAECYRVSALRWRTVSYFTMLMWFITLALASKDLI